MSWDEKDWAYTWITGKRSRINLLFRRFEIFDIDDDIEEVHTIKEYDRDVYEFSIMDKKEMDNVARDYGIMIEYRYLGGRVHCFDYRNYECHFAKIDFRNPPPFENSSLRIYQHDRYNRIDISVFEKDKMILEEFLAKIEEKLSKTACYNNTCIKRQEYKRINEAKKILKLLKDDIFVFSNIYNNSKCWFYTTIIGKRSRLNLLFRNSDEYESDDDPEENAILYANDVDINLMTRNEFIQINNIAKTYGIYIELNCHVYDYRSRFIEYKKIDINKKSPLKDVNLGIFIASFSTFNYIR